MPCRRFGSYQRRAGGGVVRTLVVLLFRPGPNANSKPLFTQMQPPILLGEQTEPRIISRSQDSTAGQKCAAGRRVLHKRGSQR